MKKLNTIIAASLLAVTAGVASAGCVFETNTPGEMFLYPGIKTDHGTGIWKTTQGATVSLRTRNVNNIQLTQARKNTNGFNKQTPAYGHIWREGNYTDTEFAYEAKYDYYALDATGKRTTISVTELNGDPISSHSPWQNWNSTSGGTEKTKISIGNIHGGNGQKSFKVEFDIRGTAAMVGNPMMPAGDYVATHEIWCIQ
jgi:hypothetical protein